MAAVYSSSSGGMKMRSYAKTLLSISSSLLIAAQQCFTAMPAAAVDMPSEAEKYAEQIGLELSSPSAENALSDLIKINNSDFALGVDSNNKVTQINGLLSENTVDNSNDAKAIIDKTSELLGITNVNREIRLDDVSESEYNRIYTFKQFYQSLEMVNSYITVVVDKESGEAEFLNSSVVSDFTVNTVPGISAQQAVEAVAEKYGTTACTSHKLAVYSEDNVTFRLVWEIITDNMGAELFYVDAETAEILNDQANGETVDNDHAIYYNNILMDWDNKILPNTDYCFSINVVRNGAQYRFHDTDRNLYLIDDPSFYVYSKNGALYVRSIPSPEYTIITYDTKFSCQEDQYSAAVMYNLEQTYDFYNNKLSYKGYDGKGSATYVIPTLQQADEDGSNRRKWANACSGVNRLCFGEGNSTNKQHYGSDIDVVAHEFTHTVTRSKVSWAGSGAGETGALNEAYSDIMGEYADPTREWQHGTDRFRDNEGKNTSDPKANCGRDMRIRQVYVDSDQVKELGSHTGSLIISNVAYWMDHLGIDADTAAKIWFTSLDYLPKGVNKATFLDCRNALIQAALKVVRNSTLEDTVTKIKTAFNRVHIFDTNEVLGDLSGDGILTTDDLILMRRALSNTKVLTSSENAQADLDFDGDIDWNDFRLLQKYLSGTITDF